jgi:hypothetical protein
MFKIKNFDIYILCCVSVGVRRYGLALLIGPNWVISPWRQRQKPVSEVLWFNKDKTMDNVQKHSNCINIPTFNLVIYWVGPWWRHQIALQIYFLISRRVYNFVRLWKLVSVMKEGKQTEGVWEQGAEENIWAEKRWSDRRLQKEDLHKLYSSPSIIRMIKSRRFSWARHVARRRRKGIRVGFWWETRRRDSTRKI